MMSYTKQRILAALLPISGFALCFGMAASAQTAETLPVDQPQNVDGVQTACTGIGDREENETRWNNYPVKLEAVGGYGQWLGDQDVTVRGKGHDVQVHCSGPWLLMGLEPGSYRATVAVPNAEPKHVTFTVPKQGHREVIVRFKDKMEGKEKPSGA